MHSMAGFQFFFLILTSRKGLPSFIKIKTWLWSDHVNEPNLDRRPDRLTDTALAQYNPFEGKQIQKNDYLLDDDTSNHGIILVYSHLQHAHESGAIRYYNLYCISSIGAYI